MSQELAAVQPECSAAALARSLGVRAHSAGEHVRHAADLSTQHLGLGVWKVLMPWQGLDHAIVQHLWQESIVSPATSTVP